MGDTIALELNEGGRPIELRWQDRSWAVTDTPTELDMDYVMMTHPLRGIFGWRFQGTDDRGESRIFDVRRLSPDHWQLLHVYA